MIVLLVVLVSGLLLAACSGSPETDSMAVAVALAHARVVIPEGTILVSSDTVPQTEVSREAGSRLPEPALLAEAARIAGFAFGSDDDAVSCGPGRPCTSRGNFQGLVHVAEYRTPDSDSLIITLRMLSLTPALSPPRYEQVDEVHVARRGPGSDWRIERIVGISES